MGGGVGEVRGLRGEEEVGTGIGMGIYMGM